MEADKVHKMLEGENLLRTIIKGHPVIIKTYINNGIVVGLNAFKITKPSIRDWGNIDQFILKKYA